MRSCPIDMSGMFRPRELAPSVGTIDAMRIGILALSIGLAVTSVGCGSSTSTPATRSQTITVAAAASLTETFTALGKEFEAANPGTNVDFNFGSSAVLEQQIDHGAPADVFASASTKVMDRAVQANSVVAPRLFAANTLALVVKPGNPLGIASLADLKKADVVALCALEAPCGATADKALRKAKVALATDKITRGQDVKATLRQVTAGDADAAVVYVTDARTVGSRGTAVSIPPTQNVSTDYPIALVRTTKHPTIARRWIAFVRGPKGQSALRHAGFVIPD